MLAALTGVSGSRPAAAAVEGREQDPQQPGQLALLPAVQPVQQLPLAAQQVGEGGVGRGLARGRSA